MRLLPLLLALAVLAGCRFERVPPPSAPLDAAASEPAVPLAAGATDGTDEVVLYVTEWCPYCRQAREYMAAEDIPHRIVDIEKDAAGAREYAARGGTGGIPLVAVGPRVMQGWSAEVAEQMLEDAGYE